MKQSMRKKIQSSMILVIALTLIIAYAITTLVVYRQTIHIMEGEVRQEADYINVAIDTSGESYLKIMDKVHKDTRITLIDSDGNVKYDSKEDEVTFQNHKNRPEVKEALKTGSGQDIRESNTLNKEMFYYAVKLENGDILRVSKTVDTAFRTAMKVFPAMGLIALIMLAFAGILVKWQITRLIRPINRLDLENPLENDVYEELTPLLQSIDKQNKEKDAVANMRKEFSANVSHELKTPMTSMKVLADSLLEQENLPVEMYQEFMGDIAKEIDRENKIITDLLSLVKMDKKGQTLNIESININELLEQILKRLKPIAEKKNVEIVMESFRPVTAEIDETKLSLAISNLVENAVKYNHDNGWVHVSLNADHKFFYVKVEDSGIGIPKEDQAHVFERFFRVDKSHSREIGGTGLGLAIARNAVIAHRGAIKVFSEEGEGTTFTVRIPLIYTAS